MYLYNSTFRITPVSNDFDVLASVVKITEIGLRDGYEPASQHFAYLDTSSLRNLRDAIDQYLSLQQLPAAEAYRKMKELYNNG